jgi:hypothetical protein
MSKAIKTLALAMVIAACASLAVAQTPPYYPALPGDHYYPDYPVSPYGCANPCYTTPYGTYPGYTYDPDPGLSAQLRSDFNRGVDTR